MTNYASCTNQIILAPTPPIGAKAPIGPGFPHYRGCTITLGRTPGRVISPTQKPPPDNAQLPQETNIHVSCGIRTPNPSKWAAVDPRLRPRGRWDRLKYKWLQSAPSKLKPTQRCRRAMFGLILLNAILRVSWNSYRWTSFLLTFCSPQTTWVIEIKQLRPLFFVSKLINCNFGFSVALRRTLFPVSKHAGPSGRAV